MLKSKNYRRGGKTWKLIDIIIDAKYVVFGVRSPKDEIEDEKLEILNMSLLKSEKSTEQGRQSVKILTPKQLITRLPILLA